MIKRSFRIPKAISSALPDEEELRLLLDRACTKKKGGNYAGYVCCASREESILELDGGDVLITFTVASTTTYGILKGKFYALLLPRMLYLFSVGMRDMTVT